MYDEVDEKEYINRVEKNRKAGPFVVGDGMLQRIFFFSFLVVFVAFSLCVFVSFVGC